jgi:biopolymer transport protein ExbD
VRRGEAAQVQLLRAQGITPLWRQEVASNPDLIAVVSADWDTTYPLVLAVLDALHTANAQRISLKAVTAQ